MTVKEQLLQGKTSLGIELGSTRIKSVLVGDDFMPIAQGAFEWENKLENGIWTYSNDDILNGLAQSYKSLYDDVLNRYGVELESIGSIGISAMMHGYMAFDENEKLLVPFRTWRNTMTAEASKELTELFDFPVPQRWSIAHLYQAVLNNEEHISRIKTLNTLAGYVHFLLCGKKVLGVGEASGMFPIDPETKSFDENMLNLFESRIESKKLPWKLKDILPSVLLAGENAGTLTAEGARLLDRSGKLKAGSLMCPPEGDAGTGMVATNSVAAKTGNVSAGTSVFAMVVLEKPLSKAYSEIDLVTTPTGELVSMVHCNNCTSDLNAWVSLFGEVSALMGGNTDKGELFSRLISNSENGDKNCTGLLSYNYLSGEHVTGFDEGRPLFARTPNASFDLATFVKMLIYSSFGALKTGLDILLDKENVRVERIVGHGGLFKTKGVAQKVLSSACRAPVSVMETAGEGGAWGIALLASYALSYNSESLSDFLNERVFKASGVETVMAESDDIVGFENFMSTYKNSLAVERAAVEYLK